MIDDKGGTDREPVIFKIQEGITDSSFDPELNARSDKWGLGVSKDNLPVHIEVIAYSGYKANERPLSFVYQERRIEVEAVIDRWYGVEHDYFKIRANDEKVYLLKWHRTFDVWLLVKVMERMGRQ